MTSRQGFKSHHPATWKDPLGIFLVVLAFHLVTFDLHPILHGDDYVAYLANARTLLDGAAYGMPGYIMNTDYAGGADLGQAAYPVGLPLLILPIAWWVGDNVPALLGGVAVLNCGLVAVFASAFTRLGQQMAGRRAGLVAGIVAGFNPFLFDQGAFRTPSEPAFLAAMVITLLLDARLAARGRRQDAAWVGAAAAITGMMRVVGILLIPAVLLAEAIRRRRIGPTVVLAGAVAVLLVALGLTAMGQDYFVRNFAIFGSRPHVAVATTEGLWPRLQQNLVALPGNLSVFWGYGWRGNAPYGAALHRVMQIMSVLVMLGAMAGFVLSWRRGGITAAVFVGLQTALLLVLPLAQQSPRYYLPVSILLLLYLLVACEAGRTWRTPRFGLGVAAIFTIMALNWPDALAARANDQRFSILEPRMTELAAWIRSNTPTDAVMLAHRPRTMVLLTARAASDFTMTRADAGFDALVEATSARLLVVSIDSPEFVGSAVRQGLTTSDPILNEQLDAWEHDFFAAAGAPPHIGFRNTRFRVYVLGGGR